MNVSQRKRYLEFERPLAELDEQIEKLKALKVSSEVDITTEVRELEKKSEHLLKTIFSNLSPYQQVQLSRHPNRPTTLDYIGSLFDDFVEMAGDRAFAEDASIVGGMARLEDQTVMLMGHQKGRNTEENRWRNFGMPRPEGYRKALRLMKLAERWKLPIITFLDTPGAYPGLDAEERFQSEAIARNIMEMSGLQVPILSVILGEGGSGGALALAVCDRLLMLQYSMFSVISPEGCAAITWKDGAYIQEASEALKLTADHIYRLGIADKIVDEALGGAHRQAYATAFNLKKVLLDQLQELKSIKTEELLEGRYRKYRKIGGLEAL